LHKKNYPIKKKKKKRKKKKKEEELIEVVEDGVVDVNVVEEKGDDGKGFPDY
jgi:hypothetical protein